MKTQASKISRITFSDCGDGSMDVTVRFADGSEEGMSADMSYEFDVVAERGADGRMSPPITVDRVTGRPAG